MVDVCSLLNTLYSQGVNFIMNRVDFFFFWLNHGFIACVHRQIHAPGKRLWMTGIFSWGKGLVWFYMESTYEYDSRSEAEKHGMLHEFVFSPCTGSVLIVSVWSQFKYKFSVFGSTGLNFCHIVFCIKSYVLVSTEWVRFSLYPLLSLLTWNYKLCSFF